MLKEIEKMQADIKYYKNYIKTNKGKLYECTCGDVHGENYCIGCDKTDLIIHDAFKLQAENERYKNALLAISNCNNTLCSECNYNNTSIIGHGFCVDNVAKQALAGQEMGE